MSTDEWTAARGTDGTWNVVGKDGAIICGCVYPSPDDEAIAHKIAAAPDLLSACEAQHDALDFLLAMLVQRDADFRPTQCPAWGAVLKGNSAIAKAKGTTP